MPRVKVPVPAKQAVDHTPATPVVEASAQVPADTEKRPFTQRFTREQWLMGAVGVLFLVLIIALFSLLHDKNQLQTKVDKLSNNSAGANQDEVNELTRQIGSITSCRPVKRQRSQPSAMQLKCATKPSSKMLKTATRCCCTRKPSRQFCIVQVLKRSLPLLR